MDRENHTSLKQREKVRQQSKRQYTSQLIKNVTLTIRIKAKLIRIDNAIWDLQTHHELPRSSFTSVDHSDPLQALSEL